MTDQSAAGPTTNFNYLKTGAGKTERKALCICCSYPGTQLALPGCVRDQAAMVDMLPKQGYDVTFLTDGDNYHEKPTKANIVREMKKLCAWLSEKEGRQGWISYSGHGAQVPDDEIQKVGYSEEKDGMDEAMVNIDYQSVGLLTDDELKEVLVFSKGSSLMVFMDCCHSGTILDLPYRLTHEATGPAYDVIPDCGTIFCVSAALDEQCAYETSEGGVCTRAFLGAYRKGQPPGQMLQKMRAYAQAKKMPQQITMNSNRPFTDADGSFIDADPAGGICESLLNCLTGETSATRSIEIGNKQDKGQIPPSKPCTAAGKILPQPTKDYVKSIREKNGYVVQL